MEFDKRLENVAVIGAAGKMGSGIAALIGQEMAKLKLKPENKNKIFRLNLIDVSESALDGLRRYLRTISTKASEKSIVMLRDVYKDRADLIENWQVINEFTNEILSVMQFGTSINMAKDAKIVFEAIVEDKEIKIKVYRELNDLCSDETFYLTNTSSIPITILDEQAGLGGRIIGYHFYNPPVVQRLVEVITGKNTKPELVEFGTELGKRLRKKLVPANDIAGFIGNGHFMRDGLFAIQKVEEMKETYTLPGAIYIMNKVSQDFLVRPMGIFQLIDYVGIDVFQCILKVMKEHLGDETLNSDLVNQYVEKGILGGQRPDGSQKDGFLKYEKSRPVGVYDLEKGDYKLYEGWKDELDKKVGNPPEGFLPWRALLRDAKKEDKLSTYFSNLKKDESQGSDIARAYLLRTKEIAEGLVNQGVANTPDDINAVLTNGFFWLYGPINNYI
ncbi:MAG: 3-hydroxyacyl-CoA dehydrogenase family protein [Candidatus Cloacimonadota bacterium]|nr:MAG: 3-hydroxyacyl-CoA dehydrogenase family protein [Candidatus Cloacimonadota bacterium]